MPRLYRKILGKFPAGVAFAATNSTGAEVTADVVPYRYGNKIQDAGTQQTATMESVFKSSALSAYLTPVEANMIWTGENTVGYPWDSTGSWTQTCYSYGPSSAGTMYSTYSGMYVVLKAVQPILFSFASTNQSSKGWQAGVSYGVGSSSSVAASSSFSANQVASLNTDQYIRISSTCNSGLGSYSSQVPGYLAHITANQFFTSVTVVPSTITVS